MREIFEVFERAGKEIYLVGGAVRDLALGVPWEQLDDLDFCTDARPHETLALLRQARMTTYDVGIEFGTVGTVLSGPRAQGYPKDCQITTYRSAEYYRRGSRHPEVRYGQTLLEDLRRRDFSINSIAMDAQGRYIDPYDGLGDLRRGLLRVVSDPLETLAEDPLRILRVGRFVSKLGFTPSEGLIKAATQRAGFILDISRERWLVEMSKLLKGPYAEAGLSFLQQVSILGIILPELAVLHTHEGGQPWRRAMTLLTHSPKQDGPRWAALLHAIGMPWVRPGYDVDGVCAREDQHSVMLTEGIAKRFKFDNKLADEVQGLIARYRLPLQYEPSWSDAQLRELALRLDPYLEGAVGLARAEAALRAQEQEQEQEQEQSSEVMEQRLDEFLARVSALEAQGQLRPKLPVGLGKAIMDAFGLKPGPQVGQLKERVEALIVAGSLANGQDCAYYVDHLKVSLPDTFLPTGP